jgi:hypothetical protein
VNTPGNPAPIGNAGVTRLPANQEDLENLFVPSGKYELAFQQFRLERRFNRDVLEMWFAIQDFGPYFGILLPRYYNVTRGKRRQSFRARPRSNFCLEYCSLFDRRPRFGASPLDSFKSHLFLGVVEVVRTDYRQKQIAQAAQYSKIVELRRVL